MMEITLKVQRHFPDMPLPTRAHPSDAGLDLTAMAVESLRQNIFAFDTGISVQVSSGYYCEVMPRSSIIKTDFILANSVGIIDADYRGRIRVVLRYLGGINGDHDGMAAAETLVGTRIAQLLVRKCEVVRVEAADDLADTPRGEGGFGSSGA